MIYEKVNLSELYTELYPNTILEIYAPDNFWEIDINRKREGLLIFPGGAYCFVSEREGEPVAFKFLAKGFACFLLHYPVNNLSYPHPLLEAIAALDYVNKNADNYHVNINKIGAIGFSAGGHLAASLGLYYNYPEFHNMLNINCTLNLDYLILGYPVIKAYPENEWEPVRTTIMKCTEGKPELIEFFNINTHVDENYPRTYIWTTKTDDCVPYSHTVVMDEILTKKGVKHKTHIFEEGPHGASINDFTCNGENDMIKFGKYKDICNWVNEAIDFVRGE